MSSPDAPLLPLWSTGPAPEFPALTGDLDVEVLVLGAGITGITLAWTLAHQGALVAVLDAGAVAGGASGRNAGFLLASPAEPYREMVALWGPGGARAVLETGRRSHARIRELVESLGLDCEYRDCGSYRLATDGEEADEIRASLPLMRADGFTMEEVPLNDAVPPYAAEYFEAAFFTPADGEIQPVRFLRGLAVAAAAKGVRFFERTPATAARWQAGLWTVQAGAATARARVLVLANNAWVPELVPALRDIVVPHRGQMLATAPLKQPVTSRPVYAHWGYRYWRQTPDGRLVIGGWRETDRDAEIGYAADVSPKVQQGIESGVRALVPGGAPVDYRWSGTMAFARDGRPLVGWLDAAHHLAICAAYTGHGLGMAAACTLDLASLIAFREAPGIATFDPGRFPELRQVREGVTALGAVQG